MSEIADEQSPEGVSSLALTLVERLASSGLRIACAESCSGGMVAAAITDVPGASEIFWGSIVSYTGEAKNKVLGVQSRTLESHGAVSRETAREMAAGALEISGADIVAANTGFAGPGGGTQDNPVGTVWIAIALKKGGGWQKKFRFTGSRNEVREQATRQVLQSLMDLLAD